MSNLDFSKLNPEQERVFRDAYRYIRQRAAWLRAQKKTPVERPGSNTQALTNPEQQNQPHGQSFMS